MFALTPRWIDRPAHNFWLEQEGQQLLDFYRVARHDVGGFGALDGGRNDAVAAELDRIVADPANPIAEYRAYDVKQSMDNGGGPACLRLRVVLSAAERAAMNPKALLDEARHAALVAWVKRHYRDRLAVDDLADPALIDETRRALDELTGLLGLGSIYAFQTEGTWSRRGGRCVNRKEQN